MSLYFVGDLNILADKRLSMADKMVYFALVSFMNVKDGKCYPRFATIKKRTGISRSAIQRSIKHLAKLQLITVKRRASTNDYLLTRQKILQETIKKRVKSLLETTENSHRDLLIKPSYLTNNNRYKYNVNKFYNRKFSRQGVANPSYNPTFEYEGEKYKLVGTIDHWVEYENKKGERIRKHKWKNIVEKDEDPRKKKFKAAAEKAA